MLRGLVTISGDSAGCPTRPLRALLGGWAGGLCRTQGPGRSGAAHHCCRAVCASICIPRAVDFWLGCVCVVEKGVEVFGRSWRLRPPCISGSRAGEEPPARKRTQGALPFWPLVVREEVLCFVFSWATANLLHLSIVVVPR